MEFCALQSCLRRATRLNSLATFPVPIFSIASRFCSLPAWRRAPASAQRQKGWGKNQSVLWAGAYRIFFFSRQEAGAERSSCTEQRRHLLDNSQHSPPSFIFHVLQLDSFMIVTSVMGANQSFTTPKCQIISLYFVLHELWYLYPKDFFSSLIYQR